MIWPGNDAKLPTALPRLPASEGVVVACWGIINRPFHVRQLVLRGGPQLPPRGIRGRATAISTDATSVGFLDLRLARDVSRSDARFDATKRLAIDVVGRPVGEGQRRCRRSIFTTRRVRAVLGDLQDTRDRRTLRNRNCSTNQRAALAARPIPDGALCVEFGQRRLLRKTRDLGDHWGCGTAAFASCH